MCMSVYIYICNICVYNLHVQAYLFFFFWKIIALQFCVGFCNTPMRISHSCIHVPFISNLPPPSHPTHPDPHRKPGWAPCVWWHTSFIALHFTALCKSCIFYKLKVYGNLSWSKTFGTIFSSSSGSLCVSVSFFGNSHNILNFSITIILVIMISDQWTLMLLLEKDYMTHWRHRGWLPFLSNKVFLIKVCIYILR